jgi:chemotaxis signal transduction protein
VAELRNVIIFAIGTVRYAIELRWVREVVSLGFVTTVPTAPPVLGGVCNLHGSIVPVLDVGVLVGGVADGMTCALRVDQVEHVASLHESDGEVLDATGRPLLLLDASRLVRHAVERITAEAERSA